MGLIEADWDMDRQAFCASTIIDSYKNAKESNYCLNNERMPDERIVIVNRSRLQLSIGISRIVWMKQVHGKHVSEVSGLSKGEMKNTDACWTREKGIGLAVLTADCMPIVFVSKSQNWLGVAHAGWRGLAGGVIEALVGCYPSSPSDLIAWIGPSISKGKYEVGEDVWSIFDKRYSENDPTVSNDSSKRFLNLIAIAESQLHKAGLKEIFFSGLCSFSDTRFFSVRRFRQKQTNEYDGRIATVAFLKE